VCARTFRITQAMDLDGAGFGSATRSTPGKNFVFPPKSLRWRGGSDATFPKVREEAMARWKVAARLEDELTRRRQYRGSLVERHPDGSTGGVDTRELERALLERVHPPAPLLDVIREKCLDCCCYQPGEIDRCTAVACSLWPYRFGTNPFSNRRGNPEALLRAKEARQYLAG
jgi:hypothetical protein